MSSHRVPKPLRHRAGRPRGGTAPRDRRRDRAAPSAIGRIPAAGRCADISGSISCVAAGKTQRKPFLALAAELRQPVRWRARHRAETRKSASRSRRDSRRFFTPVSSQSSRITASRGFSCGIDAALRHLPFQAGENDFRAVVPESPSDQALSPEALNSAMPTLGRYGFVSASMARIACRASVPSDLIRGRSRQENAPKFSRRPAWRIPSPRAHRPGA